MNLTIYEVSNSLWKLVLSLKMINLENAEDKELKEKAKIYVRTHVLL